MVRSFLGQEMLVENYFTSVLGAPALNMGVFVGIIAGFVGGVVYNKYYNFRKLPDAWPSSTASASCPWRSSPTPWSSPW